MLAPTVDLFESSRLAYDNCITFCITADLHTGDSSVIGWRGAAVLAVQAKSPAITSLHSERGV
jgi:hypothetical protein